MKLVRVQKQPGSVTPGLLISDDLILDAAAFGQDWNEDFFATDGLMRLESWLASNLETAPRMDRSSVSLAPAIARPSKLVCVGLNYARHAEESGMDPPSEPVLFMKATSSWTGPYEDVVIPRNSIKTDWEVELAVVIGKTAKYVSEADALDYVAGYAVHNDYSERQWQLEKLGQWVKGKSADTFAPFGPFMATRDEIPDPNQLRLWLKRNGELLQDSNTSDFIFNVQQVVSYISQFMTLLPGDVISTGTPAGVGLGLDPPTYLKPGDVVELGIDGLGIQKQTAVQES